METIHNVVNAAARSIYGPEGSHEEAEPKTHCRPTEHQIRDEANGTPPAAENQLPTLGPGQAVYLNRPIVTTTNETSKLTSESSCFRDLSLKSGAGGIPGVGADSAVHHRPGHESGGDDDIQRTAREIDDESLTTEGHPRPVFVGHEASGDDICRADGRDRVQFDDSMGSTGSLKPSGGPDPERPRQGSAGVIPHMDLGRQGSVPFGARIGTVQGGTVKDLQQELEAAQTAQSGGLGGIPLVFGTGGYDPTSTITTGDSNLRQVKCVSKGAQVEQREQAKSPQEDRDLQQEPGKETNFQSSQKKDESHPDIDVEQKSHSTVLTSPTPTTTSTQCSREYPSSPTEPHQDGTTNAATTKDISLKGPGLSQDTHSPTEPSAGKDPAHVQQETQKHRDGDHPTEEHKGSVSQPAQGRRGSQGAQKGGEKGGAGHLWIKSTGTAAYGGNFDASKPGAGKEADRLLEEAGLHRSVDPKQKKGAEGNTKKGVKGNHHDTTTTSGKPADPAHHSDSPADSGKHGRLHMPGILHHHDTNKDTATSEGGSVHKAGGLGEKLEKIKEKVKLRKD